MGIANGSLPGADSVERARSGLSPNAPGGGAASVQFPRSWAGQPRSLSHPITMLGAGLVAPPKIWGVLGSLICCSLGKDCALRSRQVSEVNARVCDASPHDAPDPGIPVSQ